MIPTLIKYQLSYLKVSCILSLIFRVLKKTVRVPQKVNNDYSIDYKMIRQNCSEVEFSSIIILKIVVIYLRDINICVIVMIMS